MKVSIHVEVEAIEHNRPFPRIVAIAQTGGSGELRLPALRDRL
jgi:hypothetical protein